MTPIALLIYVAGVVLLVVICLINRPDDPVNEDSPEHLVRCASNAAGAGMFQGAEWLIDAAQREAISRSYPQEFFKELDALRESIHSLST